MTTYARGILRTRYGRLVSRVERRPTGCPVRKMSSKVFRWSLERWYRVANAYVINKAKAFRQPLSHAEAGDLGGDRRAH